MPPARPRLLPPTPHASTPQHPPNGPPPCSQETLAEQQEVLRAWHGWVLRELDHFKSKFRGAAASLLGAGDCRGFSLGARVGGTGTAGTAGCRALGRWCA